MWRRDFFNLFFNNNREVRNTGLALLHSKRPNLFCKYMNPKRAEEFLENHQLWFSSMKVFNDRSDGRWYRISTPNNSTKQQKYAIQYFKECCGYISGIRHNRKRTKFSTIGISDVYSVCSLTTDHLDKKMWNKYTNYSKGVCFEFDIQSQTSIYTPQLSKILFPVIYFDKKVDLTKLILDYENKGWYNPYSNTAFQDYFFLLCILLKSSRYSVESEWRAIWRHASNRTGCKFEYPTFPTNIYLGSEIEQGLKNIILEKENWANIYQVHEEDGELKAMLIQPANPWV